VFYLSKYHHHIIIKRLDEKLKDEERVRVGEKNKAEELIMAEKMRVMDEKLKKMELVERLFEEKEKVIHVYICICMYICVHKCMYIYIYVYSPN
jgi:hypothetical protein